MDTREWKSCNRAVIALVTTSLDSSINNKSSNQMVIEFRPSLLFVAYLFPSESRMDQSNAISLMKGKNVCQQHRPWGINLRGFSSRINSFKDLSSLSKNHAATISQPEKFFGSLDGISSQSLRSTFHGTIAVDDPQHTRPSLRRYSFLRYRIAFCRDVLCSAAANKATRKIFRRYCIDCRDFSNLNVTVRNKTKSSIVDTVSPSIQHDIKTIRKRKIYLTDRFFIFYKYDWKMDYNNLPTNEVNPNWIKI